MVPVGRPREAGIVVTQVLPGKEPRAVGKGYVVLGEAFLCGGGGGDDEDATGTELEEEDRAEGGGEGREGEVERLLEEVEMAEEGERWERGRREAAELVEEVVGDWVEGEYEEEVDDSAEENHGWGYW